MSWFDFWKHKEPEKPVVYPDELEFYASKLQPSTESPTWIVFDTETTGLDPSKDKILSIGAVKIKGDSILVDESLDIIVNQSMDDTSAVSIHEITPGKLQSGVSEKEAVLSWLHFIENGILVAHHLNFDQTMINEAMKRIWDVEMSNKGVDTAHITKKADDYFRDPSMIPGKHYGLDYLCKHFHVPVEDRHTALGDAYTTALLFLKLKSKLRHEDLMKLVK